MFRAITCYLRGLSKKEYSMLREMCGYANNLFNKGLYEVRQHYFSTGKYLRYESNYHKCKSNENYTMLQAQTAQYVLKRVDWAMMSFFACLKKAKAGEYEFERVKLPRYYKKGGLSPLIFPAEHGGCRITDGVLNIPQSHVFFREHGCHRIRIKLPPQLLNAKIKEVHIIPVSRGRAFKIQYVYMCEPEPLNLNPDNALAIDLGLDNLCACVSSDGATFIMDGRKIKSTNHHYNKQRARLQAVDIKQKAHTGRLLESLTQRRNDQVQDIMRKTARYIINYCITHDIGTLIVGNNPDWKQSINLGTRNNQNFVQIPHAYLRLMLKSHCERYGMSYIEQEESYTSKASFIDGDEIPTYDPNDKEAHHFSGVRVKRGLYRTSSGRLINADINGAANILRKCKQKLDHEQLCNGLMKNPLRIRVLDYQPSQKPNGFQLSRPCSHFRAS